MDWADLVLVSVLLVTLALYLAIQIVQPPKLAGGIPERKVNSVRSSRSSLSGTIFAILLSCFCVMSNSGG